MGQLQQASHQHPQIAASTHVMQRTWASACATAEALPPAWLTAWAAVVPTAVPCPLEMA